MIPATIPDPTVVLGKDGMRLFRKTCESHNVEDEHHVALLSLACKFLDRVVEISDDVDRRGRSFKDRLGNERARPEVEQELRYAKAFLTTLRELGLDVERPDAPRAPRAGYYGARA